jgi:dTDP-4-amino-4,6-dideoxygalactose transaminase
MADRIAQADPQASYLAHRDAIETAIARVLTSGRYVLAEEVTAFEREFAWYLGADHCVGVASGTDALVLALRAGGISAGSVVITAAHTSVATVAAIELAGAAPLLVDIEAATYTIDPGAIEDAIRTYRGPGTVRAIIAVHLYGHPADLGAIAGIARSYDLMLIEDCAQAHGAILGKQRVGIIGDVAAFSFYPTKNLGALGDGGALVTSHPDLAKSARLLREYGWRERQISSIPGMNSRLDEIQAAVLRGKLKSLDEENARRRRIAQAYDEAVAGTSLTAPARNANAVPVYHQYVVRSSARDRLREFLQARGIGTSIHYPVPIHLQPAYRNRIAVHSRGLGVAEVAAHEILSLPMHAQLTSEQIQRVCDALRASS